MGWTGEIFFQTKNFAKTNICRVESWDLVIDNSGAPLGPSLDTLVAMARGDVAKP